MKSFTIFELIVAMFILTVIILSALSIYKIVSNNSKIITTEYRSNFKLNRIIRFIANRLQYSVKKNTIFSIDNNKKIYQWMVSPRYLQIGKYDEDMKIYLGNSSFIDINGSNPAKGYIYLIKGRLDIVDSLLMDFTNNKNSISKFGNIALMFENSNDIYFVKCKDGDCNNNKNILELKNNSTYIDKKYQLITQTNALVYYNGKIDFCNSYSFYNNQTIDDAKCYTLCKNISYFSINKIDNSLSIKLCIKQNLKNVCKKVII